MKRLSSIAVVAAVLVLGGCAAPLDLSDAQRVDDEAPSTISSVDLAIAAERVVADDGFVVQIDCGAVELPFVVGTSVECSAVDPATGEQGGYTVTITSIDGVDYGLEVVGSAVDAPAVDSALELASAFADLTAQAITDSLGEYPTVDCGTADIEIFVGQEVRCAFTISTRSGLVLATVTDFDGTSYQISVIEE